MKDTSKWFIYETENGAKFGCFRIKPINDSEYIKAFFSLKPINDNPDYAIDFLKIIARYLVHDWENIELDIDGEGTGKATPYTPDMAYLLFVSSDIGMNIATWVIEKAVSITTCEVS